jgi:tetratricopeptide (TPR) repeat protein
MGLIGNIYGFLGYYNHSRKKNDKALKWYKKAEEHDVASPYSQMAYGVLLLRTGQFEKAQAIFNKLLVFFPKNQPLKTNAKINLALTYWKLGDVNTAVETMSEVHNRLKNTKTYGTLGYLLVETGDYERALQFNLNAMNYDDTDAIVLDNLGQVYYRMGDMDKAFEYFKKAQAQNEEQPVTLYHLGIIHIERGQAEEARELFKKALSCNISALSTISREAIENKLKELGE